MADPFDVAQVAIDLGPYDNEVLFARALDAAQQFVREADDLVWNTAFDDQGSMRLTATKRTKPASTPDQPVFNTQIQRSSSGRELRRSLGENKAAIDV